MTPKPTLIIGSSSPITANTMTMTTMCGAIPSTMRGRHQPRTPHTTRRPSLTRPASDSMTRPPSTVVAPRTAFSQPTAAGSPSIWAATRTTSTLRTPARTPLMPRRPVSASRSRSVPMAWNPRVVCFQNGSSAGSSPPTSSPFSATTVSSAVSEPGCSTADAAPADGSAKDSVVTARVLIRDTRYSDQMKLRALNRTTGTTPRTVSRSPAIAGPTKVAPLLTISEVAFAAVNCFGLSTRLGSSPACADRKAVCTTVSTVAGTRTNQMLRSHQIMVAVTRMSARQIASLASMKVRRGTRSAMAPPIGAEKAASSILIPAQVPTRTAPPFP